MKDIFINSHSCKCSKLETAVLRLFMRCDQGARRMKRARSSASPAAAAPQPQFWWNVWS